MRIVDESTFRMIMDYRAILPDIRESLALISSGNSVASVRKFIEEPENSISALILGGYVSEMESICLKMVGQFSGRQTQTIVLLDSVSGEPIGMVAGGYVCDFRTGSVTAVATDLLAREDAMSLAVIGTGAQSVTQVQGVMSVREIQSISVWNRTRSRSDAWLATMRESLGKSSPEFLLARSVEEAVQSADIVVTSTSSREPILKGEWLKPGTHVNAVGAGADFQRELDDSVLTRADIKTVDDRETALAVGDFVEPLRTGLIAKTDVYEIGEVILGRRAGRENDQQISLFKSVGHIANDIAVAKAALSRYAGMEKSGRIPPRR